MTAPGTQVQLSDATLKQFALMAGSLERYEGGNVESILQSIFKAQTVDDYNKIFGGERAFPLNRSMKITNIRYAESDFKGGIPFYLVIDAVDTTTGEVGEYTTGAESVVGMLMHAAWSGHLPIVCRLVQADRETRAGYKPINLVMEAIGGSGQQTTPEPKKAAK